MENIPKGNSGFGEKSKKRVHPSSSFKRTSKLRKELQLAASDPNQMELDLSI